MEWPLDWGSCPTVGNYWKLALTLTLHYGLVPWLLIAFLTIRHEFGKFADQVTPVQLLWKRFMTVVTMVTVAPLIIYLAVYGVFLGISYRAGESDKFLSPEFQVRPNCYFLNQLSYSPIAYNGICL